MTLVVRNKRRLLAILSSNPSISMWMLSLMFESHIVDPFIFTYYSVKQSSLIDLTLSLACISFLLHFRVPIKSIDSPIARREALIIVLSPSMLISRLTLRFTSATTTHQLSLLVPRSDPNTIAVSAVFPLYKSLASTGITDPPVDAHFTVYYFSFGI